MGKYCSANALSIIDLLAADFGFSFQRNEYFAVALRSENLGILTVQRLSLCDKAQINRQTR